tara:strand:+ start:266 stop:718 length:453 start_codon:yes stop_codon:yes gene_type:complete
MSFFNQFNKMTILQRQHETKLYGLVMDEIKDGIRHQGSWGKALVKCEGDEQKASAEYIKIRVQELKDDMTYINIIQDEQLESIQAMARKDELLYKNRKQETPISDKEKDSTTNNYKLKLFNGNNKKQNEAEISSLAKSRIAERMRKLEDN